MLSKTVGSFRFFMGISSEIPHKLKSLSNIPTRCPHA
jgi:hypothetical protein